MSKHGDSKPASSFPDWKCFKCGTTHADPTGPCSGDDGKCMGRKFVRYLRYQVRQV